MNERPEVSVVMSVYNGAAHLRETIDSILSQEGVSLEFVIVNDGSTDQSSQILGEFSDRDVRVRIIHQENQGLTKALITGCAAAKGYYIARQDVGDISLPDRMARQLNFIKGYPDCGFVSCGTRFVGPRGELLFDVNQTAEDATTRLLTLDPFVLRGPSSHPSTIFSRALYERVGGYRSSFYFAQDLDLWIRLAEQGKHLVMPDLLYQASISVVSISGLYRREQVELTRLILESTRLRRIGMNDDAILQKAAAIRPSTQRSNNRLTRARALYFIGACLRKRRDPKASDYFIDALRTYPLHLKSFAKLLIG